MPKRSGSSWALGPWDSLGTLGRCVEHGRGPLGATPTSGPFTHPISLSPQDRIACQVSVLLSHLLDITAGSSEVESLCGALFVGVISQTGQVWGSRMEPWSIGGKQLSGWAGGLSGSSWRSPGRRVQVALNIPLLLGLHNSEPWREAWALELEGPLEFPSPSVRETEAQSREVP